MADTKQQLQEVEKSIIIDELHNIVSDVQLRTLINNLQQSSASNANQPNDLTGQELDDALTSANSHEQTMDQDDYYEEDEVIDRLETEDGFADLDITGDDGDDNENDPEAGLPAGWIVLYTDDGHPYYWEESSNTTTWTKPYGGGTYHMESINTTTWTYIATKHVQCTTPNNELKRVKFDVQTKDVEELQNVATGNEDVDGDTNKNDIDEEEPEEPNKNEAIHMNTKSNDVGIVSQTKSMESMDDEWECALMLQLEDVVNKEMTRLISLYDLRVEQKQQLLSTSGVISCPLPNCSPINPHFPPDANDQDHNDQSQNNFNNNDSNNRDENRQNKSNNSGGGDEEDKTDPDVAMSAPCDHLDTCATCRRGWTQKCEQINIFKALLITLQKQHTHHVTFVETLCKAIANAKQKGNKKTKAKNRRKMADSTPTNEPSYDPLFGAKQNLNIKISRTLTEEIIPNTIKEPIASHRVYSDLNKSIAMQYNDNQLPMHEKNVFINPDFHEAKQNDSLYCRMSRMQHKRYNWQLEDKLYTETELTRRGVTLPQSSRALLQTNTAKQIYGSTLTAQSVKAIIRRCKWNTIPVFNTKNNTKRMTLSMEQEKLNPMIERALTLHQKESLIPILMFGCQPRHWVEHVVIVPIDMSDAYIVDSTVDAKENQMDINIGVSLRLDADGVRITGIHLDKDKIFEQHQVLHPHPDECHCLDAFSSIIHAFHVGNPDTVENRMKDVKRKYAAYKKFVLGFVNGNHRKYDTFKQQAQVLLMHDNGTLIQSLKSMDFTQPISSLSPESSSLSYCLHSLSSNSDNDGSVIDNNQNSSVRAQNAFQEW